MKKIRHQCRGTGFSSATTKIRGGHIYEEVKGKTNPQNFYRRFVFIEYRISGRIMCVKKKKLPIKMLKHEKKSTDLKKSSVTRIPADR